MKLKRINIQNKTFPQRKSYFFDLIQNIFILFFFFSSYYSSVFIQIVLPFLRLNIKINLPKEVHKKAYSDDWCLHNASALLFGNKTNHFCKLNIVRKESAKY